jgi:hypothetical protein
MLAVVFGESRAPPAPARSDQVSNQSHAGDRLRATDSTCRQNCGAAEGAEIDPGPGISSMGPGTPGGSVFTLRAEIGE